MSPAELLETLDLHARSSITNVTPQDCAKWAEVVRELMRPFQVNGSVVPFQEYTTTSAEWPTYDPKVHGASLPDYVSPLGTLEHKPKRKRAKR